MVARRPAFALMVVLIASSAIFALAMQGAVSLRHSTIEITARRDVETMRRDAHSAASVALAALTRGRGATASGSSAGTDPTEADAPAEEPEQPEMPELPPEIQDLLFGQLGDAMNDAVGGEGSVSVERSPFSTGGPFSALLQRGIPSRPLRISLASRRLSVALRDEGGLVNVNVASEERLASLFGLLGLDAARSLAIAQQIVDWRDEDDFTRPRGAERDHYLRIGVSIRNGPFETLEELLFLPATTPRIFETIRHALTVAGDGAINAGSAPRAVLLSDPALDAQAVDEILRLRAAGELSESTLTEAVGPLGLDALPRLSLTPSAYLRVEIRPVDAEGPVFEGRVHISDSRGVVGPDLRLRAAPQGGTLR